MEASSPRGGNAVKRIACLFVAIVCPVSALHADWLQFRGPTGFGIALDKNLPTTWSDKNNLAWKTELPGWGASSPIVLGNRVFVTCYSGYGLSKDDPGEQKNLM